MRPAGGDGAHGVAELAAIGYSDATAATDEAKTTALAAAALAKIGKLD